MERNNNKKTKKKERTSPLQDLNRIPPSTSTSIEAPNCCLKFLLSSSNSNPSSSSSTSRSHFQRKPKSLSKLANKSLVTTKPRSKPSKENDLPKPSSKNPKMNPQCHSGKNPTSKNSQRSKLSFNLRNSLKNPASGSERFGVGKKDLKHKDQERRGLGEPTNFKFDVSDNSDFIENFTPVGKLARQPSLNYENVDDNPVGNDPNSAKRSSIVKTPPVEASVSPEIQCGGSCNLVVASTATPVCYGAGHLISGVADKRKSRPRGILTVGGPANSSGCGKINVCEDDCNENADEVLTKSRTSLVPVPAEGSVTWLLSPQSEEDEVKKDNANAYRPFMDSSSMCVSSSPSSYCQFLSELVSDSGDKNGSCNPNAITSTGKTRIVLLSPRRISNSQGFSETSCGNYGDSSVTPQANYSSKNNTMQKGGDSVYGILGQKTPCSVDPLSSSNAVRTPTSDSIRDKNVGNSWVGEDDCQRNKSNHELGSVAEIFHWASVSPRNHMSMWDHPGLSSEFTNLTSPSRSIDHIQLQQNLDNCASWISDSTVGNVSLSQMRISWREGLVSRIFDIDELDCCRCFSDEEKNGDTSDEFQHKSQNDFGMKEHDSFRNGVLRSPEFLEQEPDILRKGKKALSPVRPNVCAESISTDGDVLVASEDSDWAFCYKNQLFEV